MSNPNAEIKGDQLHQSDDSQTELDLRRGQKGTLPLAVQLAIQALNASAEERYDNSQPDPEVVG